MKSWISFSLVLHTEGRRQLCFRTVSENCGRYSLAFGTALCAGEDPQGLQFEQKFMRSHLLSCLADGEIKPFPCKKVTRRRKTKKTCKTCKTLHMSNSGKREHGGM